MKSILSIYESPKTLGDSGLSKSGRALRDTR